MQYLIGLLIALTTALIVLLGYVSYDIHTLTEQQKAFENQ